MSREDLQALFTELADDVAPPRPFAPTAMARAARIRRRRSVVSGVALTAVVAVIAAGSVWWRPTGTPSPVDGATTAAVPRPTGIAKVDHLPASISTDPEARPYWPASFQPPANAPSLAKNSMSHAVLLYAPYEGNENDIYAYGEGSINGGSGNGVFSWFRLDVNLTDTRDEGGNRAVPLDQNSLAHTGARAAFAQPDAVVIADLLTGTSQRFPLPGLNEDVTWLADSRHVLVSSATKTWLVDAQTGEAVPIVAWGPVVAPLVGAARGLVTLTLADDGSGSPVLRTYEDSGITQLSEHPINMATAGEHRISTLSPRGWRYANGLAQAASGQVGSAPGDFIVVFDDRAPDVSNILDLGRGRNKGCCSVLGWMNSDVVLVYTEQDGLLSWRLSTGAVTRLTTPAAGAVSIAPMGCDWTVMIGGAGASCIT